MFWAYLIICLVLLAFAGITSGLALGLLSFSQVDLEVLIKAGQPQAQKNATKVIPVVKNEHLLLCTLLTGKSLAMAVCHIYIHYVSLF
jgi:metal transporter CNNM